MKKSRELVLMTVLRETWREHPPVGDPHGDRVFVRWVEMSEEDLGWNDWEPVALLHGKEVESTICEDPDTTAGKMIAGIRQGLARGEIVGEGELGDIWWQWARSSLDGPPGPRLLDREPAEDPLRN